MSLPEPSESLRQARLDEVLAEYMDRVDAGEVVDRATVLAAHPDLAEDLRAYFEASDEVRRLADSGPGSTPPSGVRPTGPASFRGGAQRPPPRRRVSVPSAITTCSRRSPPAAWGSSTRPASAASTAWSPSR
jgi:hypothetical protein